MTLFITIKPEYKQCINNIIDSLAMIYDVDETGLIEQLEKQIIDQYFKSHKNYMDIKFEFVHGVLDVYTTSFQIPKDIFEIDMSDNESIQVRGISYGRE